MRVSTSLLVLALTVVPALAFAQQIERDKLTLEALDNVTGVLIYENSAASLSVNGVTTLEDGPIKCSAEIIVGHGAPETIKVQCDNGFVPEITEADVLDGDSISININLAIF